MTSSTDFVGLRAALGRASGDVVERAFAQALTKRPGSWMNPSQKYSASENRAQLPRHGHPYSAPTSRALLEYVGASIFLHMSDAWAMIGRALSSYIRGDLPIAMHLLYYAELRSAQALMARHGIVLLNKNAFIFDSHARTESLHPSLENMSTHMATWDVFSAWSDVYGAEFLGSTIRVAARDLDDWAAARPRPASLDSIAGDVMRGWGLDLGMMRGDRDRRNAVSYEPTRLLSVFGPTSPSEAASTFEEIWRVLEPSDPNTFESFDRHLLRHVLQQFFAATRMRGSDRRAFRKDVAQTIDRMGIPIGADMLLEFITTQDVSSKILGQASLGFQSKKAARTGNFHAMCGRALILARLAAGAAKDLQGASGVRADELRFWAEDVLAVHGIESVSSNFADGWADIEAALEDTTDMLQFQLGADATRLVSWAAPMMTLSTAERVSTWPFSA